MDQELSRLAARLEEARSGLVGLTQSRERVQARISALEQDEAKLGRQAVRARQFGREDIAQLAQARQRETRSQRAELEIQLNQLLRDEAKLAIAARRLQARKARIYWSGLQDQDGGDPFGDSGRR